MPAPQISTFDQLRSFITTNFPDNNSGLVDPEDVRVALRSFVDIQSLRNDLMTANLLPEQAAVWQELINKLDQIQRESKSGITGTVTQGNAPTTYVPGTPLFESYIVRAPLTMPNSWGFAVTQAELDANYVFFDVRNGVVSKEVSLKPDSGIEAMLDFGVIEQVESVIEQIKPTPFSKYTASEAVDNKSHAGWYVGISTKKINRISIPITSNYNGSVPLTDSVYVRVGLNGNFIFSEEITLAKMTAQGLDSQAGTEDKSMYKINIPEFTLNSGDVIFVGFSAKSTTDKLGFVATNILANEWINGYNTQGGFNVNDLTEPLTIPANNAVWGYNIYFTYESTNYQKVTEPISEIPNIPKTYFDKQLNRNILGSFLSKLRAKADATVVVYGDSIVQFQNSGTLALADQKINPIGLSADSWVRRLWENLKYYGNDIQHRRFDHTDFTFSNGIQTTSALIGSNGWATNRNGGEAWRDENVLTQFAQSITTSSSYSKPIVGTNKANESFTIVIPTTATFVEIVFVKPALGNNVEIKINNGTTDIVSENTALNTDNTKPTEFIKRFEFTAGTAKTLTVKNTGGGLLWVWGVNYGTSSKVRVVNSGSGGYNVSLLEQDYLFNSQVQFYNPELIVYECNILNDKFLSLTLSEHLEKVKSLFNKLKALNIPVIVILTHRGVNAYKIDNTVHSEAAQNSIEFLPELIKNYKAEAHAKGFAIIDIWAKSIDLLGTTDVGNGTSLFLDDAHLNATGNTMYSEELQKLFINEDY